MARRSLLRLSSCDRIARRFRTRSSRFDLAVTSGFLLVASGGLLLGINAHSGVAESIWGAMDVLSSRTTASVPSEGASTTYVQPHANYVRNASSDDMRSIYERRHASRTHAADAAGPKVRSARADEDGAKGLGRRSLCVRLCDGFAFPVGAYHGDQDRAAHEATCRSQCPGAQTALYVEPSGSDSMGDATQVRSGKNYSELPVAFHYTTVLSDACTCHPSSGNRIKSLLHDFTLRRGDAVMTTAGLRIFHGAPRFPYRRTDFVSLSQSRDVLKQNRGTFHAIEQASLNKLPAVKVAGAKPPTIVKAPEPARTASRAKPLQRQASLEITP